MLQPTIQYIVEKNLPPSKNIRLEKMSLLSLMRPCERVIKQNNLLRSDLGNTITESFVPHRL